MVGGKRRSDHGPHAGPHGAEPVVSRDALGVLIVDDSPVDRDLCRRMLKRSRGVYAVMEAETGEEGLRLYRLHRPDCVVLDLHLPGMDGLEFLDRLTELGGGGPVPAVMLTGHGGEAVAVEALKRGAQDYIPKGTLSAATLHCAVRNAVARVRMHRMIEAQRTALLEAERHRVVRDSLGTACHHLAEPVAALQDTLRRLGPRAPGHEGDTIRLVEECAEAAARIAQVLERLRAVKEYRLRLPDDGAGPALDVGI